MMAAPVVATVETVRWVIRQTGHGQRSWAYEETKVHMVVDRAVTRCGRRVGRKPLFGIRTPANSDLCRLCFRELLASEEAL